MEARLEELMVLLCRESGKRMPMPLQKFVAVDFYATRNAMIIQMQRRS
jgi:hypothetical protein